MRALLLLAALAALLVGAHARPLGAQTGAAAAVQHVPPAAGGSVGADACARSAALPPYTCAWRAPQSLTMAVYELSSRTNLSFQCFCRSLPSARLATPTPLAGRALKQDNPLAPIHNIIDKVCRHIAQTHGATCTDWDADGKRDYYKR